MTQEIYLSCIMHDLLYPVSITINAIFIIRLINPKKIISVFLRRFKKYWKLISIRFNKSPGRPPVSTETIEFIKKMYRENIQIGGLRIFMNLLQLGIDKVSLRLSEGNF